MPEALDETRTAYRGCPLCEAGCGLEITMRGDSVVRIRGDRDDVFSHGYICPKGSTLKQLHEDPDRLRTPLIRRDGELQPATWAEAFAEIEHRLLAVIEAHGRDAVAVYLGNPTVHAPGGLLYGRFLLKALGTKNLYSASTVDQRPKEIAVGLMFGQQLTVPVPDLDRTDHLLMLGANPFASNGSLATAPDWPGRLEGDHRARRQGRGHRSSPHAHGRSRDGAPLRSARNRRLPLDGDGAHAVRRRPRHAGGARGVRRRRRRAARSSRRSSRPRSSLPSAASTRPPSGGSRASSPPHRLPLCMAASARRRRSSARSRAGWSMC